MHKRVWRLALGAIVLVAVSTAIAPSAAHADSAMPTGGPPPTVTWVTRDGGVPTVGIDWGAYGSAPVGVIDSVAGPRYVDPSVTTSYTFTDWYETFGPDSYRAGACYDQCDSSSIAEGRAAIVFGPWLRPDVGDAVNRPGPTLAVSWYQDHFVMSWDMNEVADAPSLRIYRNGAVIDVVRPLRYDYLDFGPFTPTVTYAATACYSDCDAPSTQPLTFAQETALGPEQTVHPQSTTTDLTCTPTTITAGDTLTCQATLVDSTTTEPLEGASVTVASADHPDLGSQQCTITNGACTVSFMPTSDATGSVTLTATFAGNSDHSPSTGQTTVNVMEPTWIVAKPALVNFISPTQVFLRLSARLTDLLDHTPIAGSTIRFTANTPELGLCTAVTDADGVATCTSVTAVAEAANGYRAFFDGETYRLRSSTTGSFIRL